MEKKKHRHKFVPVDVIWLSIWASMNSGKLPKPRYVVLACTCGAVKLKIVNKVIGARKILQDYQKECGTVWPETQSTILTLCHLAFSV